MSRKTEQMLREAGRGWELVVGGVCALISVTFAGLGVWLVYLVAWRNPRQYGVNDFFKISTILILAALLAIAVGFSVFALRLISGVRAQRGLMSPFLLRIWGAFFAMGGLGQLGDMVAKRQWGHALKGYEILATSFSMATAAFVLARRRQRRV